MGDFGTMTQKQRICLSGKEPAWRVHVSQGLTLRQPLVELCL